ncbi:hypothetical protein BGW39_010490 [Mortierella sp. 14UC]|nr:hypothetical protein BGW39_010490 [Mortierella sp. 14UC]
MSTHQRLLTVHDLFLKAYSSSSAAQDQDRQQSSILSFAGQVVHAIDASRIKLLEPGLDQELKEYPLHPEALSGFKAHGDGSLPDQVAWLGPLQTVGDTPMAQQLAFRNNIVGQSKPVEDRIRQDHVVVILDSDEEEGQEAPAPIDEPRSITNKHDEEDGASSCVSWSDSNVSRSEAEEGPGGGDSGGDTLPRTMVAVLFNSTSLQDGSSMAHPLKRGDVIEVAKVLMLQKELASSRVVSCVAIAGTLLCRRLPTLQDTRAKLLDAVHSSPYKTLKRPRSNTVILDDDSNNDVILVSENPKDKKRTRNAKQDLANSLIPPSRLWSHQTARLTELDPLKFIVQTHGEKDVLDSRISHADTDDNVDYISNLWCSLPIAPLSANSIPKTPSLSTTSSSNGAVDPTIGGSTITRHICRMNSVRRAQIRAVCAECMNDYRSYTCPYGCGSRKWRAQVQLECTISDGTSVVELRLCDDQEAVMWMLLGLKESSRGGNHCATEMGLMTTLAGGQKGKDAAVDEVDMGSLPCAPVDAHKELREKVLRIVARRGFLTFKSGPALDLTSSASAMSRSTHKDEDKHKGKTKGKKNEKVADAIIQEKGHVEIIDQDTTERAKAEEKLWLDICTIHPRKQQSFILHATTSSEVANGSTPSQAISNETVNRRAVLKKSWVQMQKYRTVETMVRPPLVLYAVAAEWIRPPSEIKMLLSRLLRHSA